jgi:hypothetical protein
VNANPRPPFRKLWPVSLVGPVLYMGLMLGGFAPFGGTSVRDARAEVTSFTPGGFTVTQKLMLPGKPERVYDAITGDILPWWDHHFSEKPLAFFIEPWPGGGFYELFGKHGNGVKHATVLWAERGKRLRFEGPLGLSGNATMFVCTYDLVAKGDSTEITLTAAGAGKVDEGWPGGIDGVWRHFLYEGLKPYVESGKDAGRKPWTRQRSAALFKKNE